MPNIFGPSEGLGGLFGGGGFGGDTFNLIRSLVQEREPGRALAFPGGASLIGESAGMLEFGGGGGAGVCPPGGITSPFVASNATGLRKNSAWVVCNPVNGKMEWAKFAGKPLLWSGDLAACKRVKKIAGRARRASGGR